MQLGILYGISVGPGDPELISLKGLKILQSVPVVAFPAGVGGKLGIAQQIVDSWLSLDIVQLALRFPYVRDDSILEAAWLKAAEEVWYYLKRGQNVAFVSEGDVSFYSTFAYLAAGVQKLNPSVRVEAIPGVISPVAAATSLGFPLAIGDRSLAVLPALYSMAELEAALDWADVVVLMKVSSVYQQVWQLLERRGLLDRSYIVERATWPDMKIYRGLRDRPNLELPYFSLAIVQVAAPEAVFQTNSNF